MTNPTCKICHEPFPPEILHLNPRYHEECQNCIYCGHLVGPQVLDKLIKDEDGVTVKLAVYHQPCRDRVVAEEYKKLPVTITQEHLDILNRSHIFMQQLLVGNPEVSIETNQDLTDKMTIPWVRDMDLDGIFFFLKQVEALATRLNITLSKNKDQIRTRIQARELEKYKEVKEYRDGSVARKETVRMKSLDEITKSNEKADPQLKARRKAIEGFMKIGLSKADAERLADSANKPN